MQCCISSPPVSTPRRFYSFIVLVPERDGQAECNASCFVQELVVYGSQEPAEVALDNDAVLYFKLTCLHTTSTTQSQGGMVRLSVASLLLCTGASGLWLSGAGRGGTRQRCSAVFQAHLCPHHVHTVVWCTQPVTPANQLPLDTETLRLQRTVCTPHPGHHPAQRDAGTLIRQVPTCKTSKKFELMLMSRATALVQFCAQVILIYLQ